MPLPPPQPKYGGMAIRFFAHEHCQIEDIAGLEAARAEPGVARVDCHLQPGAVLGPLAASKDRQGYVLATGTSAADAWAAASRAMSRIHVTPVPSSARAAT